MRRVTFVVVGALLVGGLLLALRGRPYRVPERPTGPPSTTPGSSRAETAPIEAPSASSSGGAAATPLLPDGRPVPELPSDAPKSVSFGVVVITFRGAEGAPGDARPKDAALAKAREILLVAEKDFDQAVKLGDHGSMGDAGSVPRGVLEPGLEYALFTLKKGQVYGGPLESPRGYWVVRRN